MADPSIRKTIDNVAGLLGRVAELTGSDVLVGVPREKAGRKEGAISNASLAYIHEFGSPAHNIPARPFLFPGIRKVRTQIVAMFRKGAVDALKGSGNVSATLNSVGMLARNSVVSEITDPAPPFVPLKYATIRARLRRTGAGRRKLKKFDTLKSAAGWSGAQAGAAMQIWGTEEGNIHPLIDTGQLRASITYVVRKT